MIFPKKRTVCWAIASKRNTCHVLRCTAATGKWISFNIIAISRKSAAL